MRVLAAPAEMPPDGNPYITSLYAAVRAHDVTVDDFTRRLLLDHYDVVHVHWPESLVRWNSRPRAATDVAKVLSALALAQARGTRLLWTGHNLGAHDMAYPFLYESYITAFARMTDGLISLGSAATEALHARYPALRAKPVWVVPHGHYRDDYAAPPPQNVARTTLDLPAEGPLLLLLGQIRRYKNVPALISAFSDETHTRAHLAVVGEVRGDRALADEIRMSARATSSVTIRLERVAAEAVPLWHAAADVVVLPYTGGTALNSGAALLALSMDTPVVVPDSGPMRELRDVAGKDWVHTFDGDPRRAVRAALDIAAAERPTVDLRALDWSRLGGLTAEVYRHLAHSRTKG